MKKIKGVGATDFMAVGEIFRFDQHDYQVCEINNCNPYTEKQRFEKARVIAVSELDQLYHQTKDHLLDSAKVFEAHKLICTDILFEESVLKFIEKGKNAEYAVQESFLYFQNLFEKMNSELMKSRVADIHDVMNRFLRILQEETETYCIPNEKIVLVSKELAPSDIVKFNPEQILGIITKFGSKTSHSAIFARTLNIPMVIQVGDDYDLIPDTGVIGLNGATGEVYIHPTKQILVELAYITKQKEEEMVHLQTFKEEQAKTKSGQLVRVLANASSRKDVLLAKLNGCDGIGMFRTEFLYLESNQAPTEEEQYQFYIDVIDKMNGKIVVFRTLDLGSDKFIPYLSLPIEDNPALGLRGVRYSLKEQDLFVTQLRALLRASVKGRMQIMFPMITTLEEVKQVKEIVEEVKKQLDTEQLPYDKNIELGIMIETPASCLIAPDLAKEVHFFSIGTNDLTQYVMACDRLNSNVSTLYNTNTYPVKFFIKMAIQAAKEAGIIVSICGESAGDPEMLDFYLQEKVDVLSLSPGKILPMKQLIRERDVL